MAFSTQKEFFHVPFMNETVDFECRRACVQLKSYDSTIDDRAWALDETNRSRFLSDLVTCKTPVTGYEDSDDTLGAVVSRKRGERGRRLPSDSRGINPADSLIAATNVTLDKVQGLLQDKRNLQQKLNKSEDSLKTAKAEYEKIRDILNRKFDRSDFKDYYNKIQKMAACGVFTKNDENEFLQFFRKMEDLGKAYEVSQAENSYLKRLIEKLSRRAEMEKIPCEPETSVDIPYLQDQVNKLRKELMALRKLEDNKMNITESVSDINVDANNLNHIINERNALRERLRTMQDIEKQVCELRKRLCDASDVSNNLSNSLDKKSKYICDLENDMREMQSHYEQREEDRCGKLNRYEREYEQMKRELCAAKLEAQKVSCLKACIARLEESIKQKDRKLCDYDSQFKQLMCVINELRGTSSGYGGATGSSYGRGRQDCETQTTDCSERIEELAFYTSATLEHIQKELKRRGMLGKDSGTVNADDCCKEVERLRKIICQLQSDKSRLSSSLMDRNKCMDGLASRLDDLCGECNKNAKNIDCARKNLNNCLDLASSIAEMQDENQKLVGIADNLSKKEIDDLIGDLTDRLKKCLEEKEDLKIAFQRKGFDPEAELKAVEASRERGSLPPRKEVDMGPVVSKLIPAGVPEKGEKLQVAIDPATGKPIPGAVAGQPSVIDPATGKPIPGAIVGPDGVAIDSATGKPIPGAVVVEPIVSPSGVSVIDPATGKPIPGAVVGPDGVAIDSATGKPIPGAVVADLTTGKPIVSPSGVSVIDPVTGKPIPGAVVGPDGVAIDSATGKPIPGAVLAEPTTGKPIVSPSGVSVIDPATGKPIPGAVVGPDGVAIDSATGKPIPGAVVADPTTGKPIVSPSGVSVIDPATGKPIPGAVVGPDGVAIDSKTGKPIPGAVVADPTTGKPISSPSGVSVIDPATGKPIPGAVVGPDGVAIDSKTGKPIPGAVVADPTTGKPISSPSGVSVIDPATGKPIPGAVVGPDGVAIDSKTGKPIPGAVVADPITGKPVSSPVTGRPSAVAKDPATGKPVTGRPSAVIKDPATGKPIPGAAPGGPGATTIDPATGKQVTAPPGAVATDPATGKPIPGAVPGGPGPTAVDPATGKPIPGAAPGGPGAAPGGPGTPAIDPTTGKPIPGAAPGRPGAPAVDPATGKPIPGAVVGPDGVAIDSKTGKPIPGAAPGRPGAPAGLERPSASPVRPSQAPIRPSQAPVRPSQSPVRPSQSPVRPSQAPASRSGGPGAAPGGSAPVAIDPVTGEPIPGAVVGGPVARKPVGSPVRPSGVGGAGRVRTRSSEPSRESETGDQYTDFVARNADTMNVNLQAGNSLQNELRKILDAFVEECRFCLCQSRIPKSKFYAICHKMLHEGIMNLTFKDISYLHKKIYYASEKLYPGCLLKVILSEYVDVAQMQKKCCQCKSVLCCDSSQELLKDKVRKLEVEVEIARDYLNSIRSHSHTESRDSNDEDTDDQCATYRQDARKKTRSSPKLTNKQIRSIKACITKCSQNIKG